MDVKYHERRKKEKEKKRKKKKRRRRDYAEMTTSVRDYAEMTTSVWTDDEAKMVVKSLVQTRTPLVQ